MCDISTSRWATRCRTSPSHCHVPYTARSDAPSASCRNFSCSEGQMMTLALPVSSSMVTKITLFAVPGRWRTVTNSQPRASLPLRFHGRKPRPRNLLTQRRAPNWQVRDVPPAVSPNFQRQYIEPMRRQAWQIPPPNQARHTQSMRDAGRDSALSVS